MTLWMHETIIEQLKQANATLLVMASDLHSLQQYFCRPVKAVMTLTTNQEKYMPLPPKKVSSNSKAAMDLTLTDTGSGAAALTLYDTAGLLAVVPSTSTVAASWTSSDPSIVVTPGANPLNATFAPSVPPVAVTGVTITAVVTITDPTIPTITLTAVSQGIDVVGGDAASMQMVLSD
jgi:hypothetical protein